MKDIIETYVEKLPEFGYGTISSVYIGKPDTCMCGCAGKYYYSEVNQKWSGNDRGYEITDDEVDDKKVQRVINKINKNSPMEIQVLDGYIYTAIIGKTQYTIYLKN